MNVTSFEPIDDESAAVVLDSYFLDGHLLYFLISEFFRDEDESHLLEVRVGFLGSKFYQLLNLVIGLDIDEIAFPVKALDKNLDLLVWVAHFINL